MSSWLGARLTPLLAFSLAFLAALLPCIVAAQTTGNLEGSVTDQSGSRLPGVSIELSSSSLQRSRTASTGPEGAFRFPSVPPGLYVVHASLEGFGAVEMKATVTLDATATVNIQLTLTTSAEITVTGDAPVIDSTSTTTGTSYDSNIINKLPVARNYADIVRSNPGVSTDRGDTEGRSLALAIYGATSAENQWIIDGVNTTNVFKGVQGKAINNEFVQEVEVKTGGYPAEYGRALGGVINVITKSGGNDFHGDGFVYYDSSGTEASQLVTKNDSGIEEMRVVSGQRFDYGLDLGGFFWKDRLWFFAAYNRISLTSELSRVQASMYVPTTARFPLDSSENLYSGKLTWNVAQSTTVVATAFADPSSSSGASGADPRQGLGATDVNPPVSLDPSTWYSSRTQGGTDYGVRLTQLFGSSGILVAQGSYHRDQNNLTAANEIQYVDNTCTGGTPDNPCDFPPEPNNITGGYGFIAALGAHNESSRSQAAANQTIYFGGNEIKFGGDYMNGMTNGTGFYTGGQQVFIQNEYGQLYYAHEFVATSPQDPTPMVGLHRQAQVLDYSAFVQDSWRIASNLSVNLGLRWDGEETRNYAGQTVLHFDNEWQPRIGIVWDPWKDGATKVYAFAGRFSYGLPTAAAAASFANITDLTTYNFSPTSVVQDPNVLNHGDLVVNRTGAFGDVVDKGVRASYEDELTLGIERAVMPSLTIGLKGTYRSLGNTLEDRCDFDYTAPQLNGSSCALINPGSDGTFARGGAPTCNGFFDDPSWYQCYPSGPPTPPARRYYRGLELLARETIGNQLWLQASYIYSSLRGNYDGGVNQGVYGQTSPGINSDFDYPALWHDAYGTLALDRTNRFRLDGFWVTPWRLSVGLQFYAETGSPLNKVGFFNSRYGPLVFLEPRGSVGRLPTLWGSNLTLEYPIAIGPAIVTLQATLFNVFNKQIPISTDQSWSISPPDGFPATVYDPNQTQNNPDYGSVTRRSDPRIFRAAVKVSF